MPRAGRRLLPLPRPRVDAAALSALGVETGAQLAEALLERHDIAVLQGEAFGDDPAALRFRMATSLLHGRTDDEKWEALAAEDPVALPRIRSALDRLGQALAALRSGG